MLERIRKAQDEREGGFTLIELLIVIVVLGILAAIVVFAVGSATSDSKLSACKSQVATINTALEAYKAKNGSYPSAPSSDLLASSNGGPFLKSWPSSTDYTITVTGGVASGTLATGGSC